MSIARTSLRGFLSHARTTLQRCLTLKEPVTFVIGNESADLDSITSAILYAYIRSQTTKADTGALHIPITNIPKADLSLRPELLPVCKAANIEQGHIITLDDLPKFSDIRVELRPDLTSWVLVDHNSLQGLLGEVYGDRVKACIDHHDDEGKVPLTTSGEPRIIEKTGSCTSLVSENIRNAWDELSMGSSASGSTQTQADGLVNDSDLVSLWDAQVAQLALASILIDTHNLKDVNKTTDRDHKSAEYLAVKIYGCARVAGTFDQTKYFEQVQEAKQDLDPLNIRDVLRKDYKQWTERGMKIGMSSVVKPIEYLEKKAKQEQQSLVEAIKKYAEEQTLAVSALMTAYTTADGSFARELLICHSDDAGKACVDTFVREVEADLQLTELDYGTDHETQYRSWQQGNVSASRKQVAPMLRKAMNSL